MFILKLEFFWCRVVDSVLWTPSQRGAPGEEDPGHAADFTAVSKLRGCDATKPVQIQGLLQQRQTNTSSLYLDLRDGSLG